MSRFRFPTWLTSARLLIILASGLITLIISGYTAYRIYQGLFRERLVSNIVNTETTPNVQVKTNLGVFEPLKGTNYLMAAVSFQQNYRQSYYEKEASSIRNFLFFNTSDKSARKLVLNNNFLFLRHEKLGQSNPLEDVVKNVQGVWYEVVTADSDGDKRLTTDDKKTVALSHVSGENYTEIIRQVDRIWSTHQPNDSTLLVFYTSDAKNFVTEIHIPVRQAVITQQLPSLE
ncbi:hypothetical protein IQ259_05805 [Fortiea sp. LEGE XX443]|uniref:hypothetical protein n=1 Tax=Fortiea sp. LEGE XX443 TaxID=1828611 RepID=UPI00187E8CC3|nr:hypothetical protein [Fortiea sp. LEGE XX443]MBE9004559.1 hypothetical protein [Fortiea sp. LEGE XX443]